MSQVTVVAHLKAKPGMEERVRKELMKMVEETHKEPGCINYDLHCGVEDPRHFVFYENWTSQEALDKHLQTPHFLKLSKLVSELFSEAPQIMLFEMMSKPKPVAV